jgi:hypothetical protein
MSRRDGHENHDPLTPLNLPAAIRAQASKLLTAIRMAHTLDDLVRAGVRAEGFALGIETVRALNPIDIENLLCGYESTVQKRRAELGE